MSDPYQPVVKLMQAVKTWPDYSKTGTSRPTGMSFTAISTLIGHRFDNAS